MTFFFVKEKTAYELRISDWSSDVCSADLGWDLGDDERRMLAWAARIHEIGLAIAHSQHHVHGAYLIEHSDIAGFSRQEQKMLSVLIRCQRRNISRNAVDSLPDRLSVPGLRLIVLLRLAVLLHRGHEREAQIGRAHV